MRRFLQQTLQTNRLQAAQVDLIEAKMHSHDNRNKFCMDVNLSPMNAAKIPDWYFTDDVEAKDNARFTYNVFAEASYLKKHYSPDLMVQAKSQFPNLWQHLMGSPGSDLLPTRRTKVMEQSPLISENSGYETIQIYR